MAWLLFFSWREVRALGRALGGDQPTSVVCCGGRAMAATSQVWSWQVRPSQIRRWMLGPQVFSVRRSGSACPGSFRKAAAGGALCQRASFLARDPLPTRAGRPGALGRATKRFTGTVYGNGAANEEQDPDACVLCWGLASGTDPHTAPTVAGTFGAPCQRSHRGFRACWSHC